LKALSEKVHFWYAGTSSEYLGQLKSSFINVIGSRSRSQEQKSVSAYPVRGWFAFDWKAVLCQNTSTINQLHFANWCSQAQAKPTKVSIAV